MVNACIGKARSDECGIGAVTKEAWNGAIEIGRQSANVSGKWAPKFRGTCLVF